MIRLIVFDMDGVLVDSCDSHFDAFNQALVLCGCGDKTISYSEHLEKYNGKSTRFKLNLLTKEKGLDSNKHDDVWKAKQAITNEIINSYEADQVRIDMLKNLQNKGYKIFCASNSIWKTLKTILLNRGFLKYIDYFISNEDVINPKPHPEMYLSCMKRAQLTPDEILIIEDSDVGFAAAKASGCHVMKVDNYHQVTYENILTHITNCRKSSVNVVIPMAGNGSRFQQQGYKLPKPLIEVNGKPMVQWVVDNIRFADVNARYIFIVRKEHRQLYNLDKRLSEMVPGCTIVDVEHVTEGAGCTVLLAKSFINNSDNLVIANSDQFLEWNQNEFLAMARNNNVDGLISTFTSTHPKWSYAKHDESGIRICEVAEKNPISNCATSGVYFWKRGSDFVQCAESMIQKNIRVNNEFYVCPVYNEAIEKGLLIQSHNCTQMWGLGTPEDLDYFLQHYRT